MPMPRSPSRMHESEYLLQHLVAQRLREARFDAARRAMLVRGPHVGPSFAMVARIVENAMRTLTNAPRGVVIEG